MLEQCSADVHVASKTLALVLSLVVFILTFKMSEVVLKIPLDFLHKHKWIYSRRRILSRYARKVPRVYFGSCCYALR